MKRKRKVGRVKIELPVDKTKWGANCNIDYNMPPNSYIDTRFTCVDCGVKETWTAKQQKHWYEDAGKHIHSHAIRCRVCRAHVSAIQEEQQRHMKKLAEKKPHINEAFFKKNT